MSKEFYLGGGRTERWPMITGASPMSLALQDVTIAPCADTLIESRGNISTAREFGPWQLRVPVITAPMDTVFSELLAREMWRLGGIAASARTPLEEHFALCERLSKDGVECVYSLGLRDNPFEAAKKFKERGAKMLLVDVAHGGMRKVGETAAKIQEKLDIWVIAGNIAMYEQAEDYRRLGIRIGRGPVGTGGVCITQLETGVGVPMISAMLDTTQTGLYMIADGGLWTGGDLAKVFAAGARMAMLGSRFAGVNEAGGRRREDGKVLLRGQASASYMMENGVKINGHRVPEGVELYVDPVGSAQEVLNGLMGGLRSAMSYVGAGNLNEFYNKSQFIVNTGGGRQEAAPHRLYRDAVKI